MDFTGRIGRMRAGFAEHRIDAMLVSKVENIRYLTGFTGQDAYILITPESLSFMTDSRYYEQFKQEVRCGYDLVPFFQESLGKKTGGLAAKHGFKRLGIEAAALSYYSVEELKENAGAEIVPLTGVVEKLRVFKEQEEIDCIKRAVGAKEAAFSELLKLIKPEVTEADLAAEFEYRIRKNGADAASFTSIVAFGENSSKPHATVGARKPVPASPLLFDIGAKVDGYCSDMTRTVFLGGVSPGWEKIYGAVLEAKDAAAAKGKAGMTGADIDRIARDVIAGHGFDTYQEDGEERKYFAHGLGHGVGLEVHEEPRVNAKGLDPLEPGMIITIEPGIYLPGQGGIRIEDMSLVAENGFINLNSLPTALKVVQ
jgi:Xaa-Pro aminopeptidase